jgi:predicted metal-dependent enzyme (double-stranded beta helix superfamily)
MDNRPLEELQMICRHWSAAIRAIAGRDGRIDYVRAMLPPLLARQTLFAGVLKGILDGRPYPDLRQETMFDNELVLYRDPARILSLRLYIFSPGEHTSVHDHTAWGVMGSAFGPLEVVHYRREDDGSDPEQAHLTIVDSAVRRPGETETILPFDAGIHRTGNPAGGTTLMVTVYGTPLRRLYIQRFDLDGGRVQRQYPARLKKRMLAEQALKSIERENSIWSR